MHRLTRTILTTTSLAAVLAAGGCGGSNSTTSSTASRAPAARAAKDLPGTFVALRQSNPQTSAAFEVIVVRGGTARVAAKVPASARSVVANASLSPSGQQVAYRYRGDLAIAPAAGGRPRVVAHVPGSKVYATTWAPDGKTIVFGAGVDGRFDKDELYSVPATGGRVRQLTDNRIGDEYPAVAKDGDIYFSRGRGPAFGLWKMDGDGSHQRRLTRDSTSEIEPSVSPDGTQIAFLRYRTGVNASDVEIAVAKDDGTGAHVVVGDPGGGASQDGPIWSPDGRTLLFSSNRRDLRDGLWTVPAAGGTPTPALLGTSPQRITRPSSWVG